MDAAKNSQLILSAVSHNEGLHNDSFSYQSIFLSLIVPDKSNARFLPAVMIEDEDAKLFVSRKISKKQLIDKYNAQDQVIVGKSCMINCLTDANEWKIANKTITSIIALGDNISVSELIQVPTIYPLNAEAINGHKITGNNQKYQILTGHRRFFALVYTNGYSGAAQFKLYDSKPLLSKIKQFQENASRDELPQYGKLQAFESALVEIEWLNKARKQSGYKKLTVKETATHLGISMGAFDNYNVLTRYSCIPEAYRSGLSIPFLKVKKIILEAELSYKKTHTKRLLNVTDKQAINSEIVAQIFSVKGAKSSQVEFKIKPVSGCSVIKKLLMSNIMELDTGIDWDGVDWNDYSKVSHILSAVMDYLD